MKPRTAIWVAVLGLVLAPSAHAGALGSWSQLPSMTTARYGAAAGALSDGRVLVAGGIDASGSATASAEVYDPATHAWSAVAGMGSARSFAAAAPLGGDRVLVAGGDVGGVASASAEIFNGATNTWSAAPAMGSARAGATASALPDGRVWLVGGSEAAGSELYNPATDTWSASVWTPWTVGGVAVPLPGGQVFMAGGFDLATSISTPSWGLRSPSDPSGWPSYGNFPPAYQQSAATVGKGQVLLASGSTSKSAPTGSASAEMFDPQMWTWTAVAPMATARYGAVAAPLPGGQALVAGGEGKSGPLASAEAFSPPTLANTSPPVVMNEAGFTTSGPIRVGTWLTVTEGSWNPAGPGELWKNQWQRCSPSCQDISSGAVGGNYVVTAGDVGSTLRVVQTATYQGISVSAVSNEIGPVAVPGFHLVPGMLQSMLSDLSNGRLPYLELPVERDNSSGFGQVSYRVWDPTAAGYPAFTPMSGTLTFLPGQPMAMIAVPMNVGGGPILPGALAVQLFDGSPLSVVDPSLEAVNIRDPHAALYVRDPANPLALPSTPPAGNPLGGAQFFADYFESIPAQQALAWTASDIWAAANVDLIAKEPNTQRFGAWDGLWPGSSVSEYLTRAAMQEPGTVPMISTYRIVSGHCGHWSDPPLTQAMYHDWITGLAEGIGTHPAVLFLEMDALITQGCLSKQGVAVRTAELRDALSVLSNDPHLVTYLDAGAADALPARVAARLLRRAGIANIQGFYLNSTHFDWTKKEIAYGEKISRLTGGKHFVVNTAENGQGPLRPRHPRWQGNEVLCDPPGRGLGPLPTASTGYPNVDAFAWIANPGMSGGQCRPGAPPTGVFWPTLALSLVRHADFRVR